MPYGTFTYRVLRHKIVDNGDWSIMKRVGFDELVLSACHPLYSAEQRYVIFARLQSITLPGAARAVDVLPARARSV
jgi:sortase A